MNIIEQLMSEAQTAVAECAYEVAYFLAPFTLDALATIMFLGGLLLVCGILGNIID